MIFHSHANKTHFHKKGCSLSLILKVRVYGTRKWATVSIISELFLGGESTSLRRNCWWWDDCKPWMIILLPVGCHLDGKVLSRVNWLLWILLFQQWLEWGQIWLPHCKLEWFQSWSLNSLRKQPPFRHSTTVFPQIWIVLMIDWIKCPWLHDQSEAPLPRSK